MPGQITEQQIHDIIARARTIVTGKIEPGGHSPLSGWTMDAIAQVIVHLADRKHPAETGDEVVTPNLDHVIDVCVKDRQNAFGFYKGALIGAVAKLVAERTSCGVVDCPRRRTTDEVEPWSKRRLHISHEERILIIGEARRMVRRGETAFLGHSGIQVARAIVDMADVIIETKERLVEVERRDRETTSAQLELAPEQTIHNCLRDAKWSARNCSKDSLVRAVRTLAHAPAKDNETLTAAHMEGVRILATAVQKLWPDLAEEVVKRWNAHQEGERKLLEDMVAWLRKPEAGK